MTPPIPQRTALAAPFWDGLAQGEIRAQFCAACAAHVFYPRPFCPRCGSRALDWTVLEGQPTLYSFTVADVPVSPEFAGEPARIPAIVAIGAVRMASTLVEVEPEAVRIGMALAPVFAPDGAGGQLLHFRPA